ncbi:MAG TPA: hypothetical protein VFB59_03665 [Candidatus Saccharimonadales bacterium]|nr:hypothetical protein [Candidatus Saccharimonadales bacterium]
MKPFEAIKRHPRVVAATAILLGAVGVVEAVGWAQNPMYDRPADACVSPMAVSGTYVDPGANLLLQTQGGFFTTGLIARGTLPQGAYGVEASFKGPGEGAHVWEANASPMLKPNEAGEFALKMAIGPGEVQFGVRVVAPADSPLCDSMPQVTYAYEDAGGYFNAVGDIPWPNFSNVAVNIF